MGKINQNLTKIWSKKGQNLDLPVGQAGKSGQPTLLPSFGLKPGLREDAGRSGAILFEMGQIG